jgi:hypothetical protein
MEAEVWAVAPRHAAETERWCVQSAVILVSALVFFARLRFGGSGTKSVAVYHSIFYQINMTAKFLVQIDLNTVFNPNRLKDGF